MKFADHTFDLPLDHDRPDGERITVYAREVTTDPSLPWLLFLNGGPGFPSPRPLGNEGWLLRALRDYRVLLLDQRGTGRSTPVTRRVAQARGAEYLTHLDDDPLMAPLRPNADELAERPQWSPLYDVDRLRANEVPVAAAVYDTDMYVHRDLSLATAALIGNTRVWHTPDHQHDGLRVSDGAVMARVLEML